MTNLVGERFNRLIVVGFSEKRSSHNYWLCRCDCGKEKVIPERNLISGITKSCGCYRSEITALNNHNKLKDLTGMIFGDLTVISRYDFRVYKSGLKHSRWLCQCKCGNETVVLQNNLTRGHTKHCVDCGRVIVGIKNSLPIYQSMINEAVTAYKTNAKKRNYSYELDEKQFLDLVSLNCFYCGKEPDWIYTERYARKKQANGRNMKMNGIDRKDNTKGYTTENSVPCCKRCNTAKNNMSPEEWNEWMVRFVNYNRNLING